MSAESPTLGGALAAGSPSAKRWPRWILLASLWTALLLVAFCLDQPVSHWIAATATDGTWLRRIPKLAVRVLNQWGWFVVLGFALTAQPRPWRRLLPYCVTLLAGFASLHLLKYTIGRARPDLDVGAYFFAPWADPFALDGGFDSLPSGHAFGMSLLAALLACYVPRSRWVVWPLVALGCASRVAQQRHFVSDVLAGTALAVLVVALARYRAPAAFQPLAWRSMATRLLRFGVQLRLLGRDLRAAVRRAPVPANDRSSS